MQIIQGVNKHLFFCVFSVVRVEKTNAGIGGRAEGSIGK